MKKNCLKIILSVFGARWRQVGILAAVLAVIGIAAYYVHTFRGRSLSLLTVTHNDKIEVTPEEILAMKDIAQWEFLSIDTEELVEHHEAHTFGDYHLVKIFRGRVSMGVDMTAAGEGWFQDSLSTAIVTLPPITILDDHFIDEARTTTFYEKGRFSAAVKQRLYAKAERAMMSRAMSPGNIQEAESAARDHFSRILQAFGFKEVIVRFKSNIHNERVKE